MLPVLFGAIGTAVLLDSLSDARSGRYGAVSPSMGGRGAGAGRGVATHLGGRAPDSPYTYDVPSSMVTNWASPSFYGDDDDSYGFMLFGIPFGKKSRVEHLERKIESTRDKIKSLEAEAKFVEDDSKLADFAKRIATLEAKIATWQEKLDKISESMGQIDDRVSDLVDQYGAMKAAQIVSAETMQRVELLAGQVVSSAKKIRVRPSGKQAYAEAVKMVAFMDQLTNIVDAVVRPALAAYMGISATKSDVAPSGTGMDEVLTQFGADAEDPEEEPGVPEGLADAATRSKKAAAAYLQTRRQQPELVQSVEEALGEASHKAGRDVSGVIIERVTMISPLSQRGAGRGSVRKPA